MSSSENCVAPWKIPVLVCIDVEPDEREIDPYLPARWAPELIKDGKPHSIWAKVQATEFALRLGDVEEVEPVLLLNTEPWLMARGINALLTSMARPHLVFPVRSSVSLLGSEFRKMQASFDFLLANLLRKRFVFEAPSNLVASLSTQPPGH